jgi:hypothetical protein
MKSIPLDWSHWHHGMVMLIQSCEYILYKVFTCSWIIERGAWWVTTVPLQSIHRTWKDLLLSLTLPTVFPHAFMWSEDLRNIHYFWFSHHFSFYYFDRWWWNSPPLSLYMKLFCLIIFCKTLNFPLEGKKKREVNIKKILSTMILTN